MGQRVEEFPPAQYTRGDLLGHLTNSAAEPIVLPPALAEEVHRLVEQAYPHPISWTSAEDKKDIEKRRLSAGYKLYQQHCFTCHGKTGAGDGGIATTISPRPRDFRRGTFKWKSTDRSSKPLVDDLVRTIQRGIPGTAMQGFGRLDRNDLVLIAEFVTYLSKRGEFERRLLVDYSAEGPLQSELDEKKESLSPADLEEYKSLLAESAKEASESIVQAWKSATDHLVQPSVPYPDLAERTPEWQASIDRGRDLFVGAQTGCSKCHGADGKGEQNLSPEQTMDDWGFSNPPRDLTKGIFRGGGEPLDLYRRIQQGIAGSTMPATVGTTPLADEDIWNLVRFIKAWSNQAAPTGTVSVR
jgi:mono/diheme cytochrome c family protein